MPPRLKNVPLPELNDAMQKVLIWFFSYPTQEFGLNDVVEATQISKTTANRIVENLVKQGFLQRSIIGRLWRLSCNQEHEYNVTKKIPYHLGRIYESGVVEHIRNAFGAPRAIILFGSYRRGDDVAESDLDIAVEVLDDEEVEVRHSGTIPEFGYRKDVNVNITIFSRNTVDLNLFANIANGIVLSGFLEVRP